MNSFNVDTVPVRLIMATVQVIILATFAIPTIVDMADGPGLHPGDTSDYYASASLPDAEFTFTGTAMQFGTIDPSNPKHIHFEWQDKQDPDKDISGTYDLIVTATTHQPDQSATKTITYEVEGDWSYKTLILVIPTLMILAIIIFLVKPIRESMRRNGGGGGSGDISSGLE